MRVSRFGETSFEASPYRARASRTVIRRARLASVAPPSPRGRGPARAIDRLSLSCVSCRSVKKPASITRFTRIWGSEVF